MGAAALPFFFFSHPAHASVPSAGLLLPLSFPAEARRRKKWQASRDASFCVCVKEGSNFFFFRDAFPNSHDVQRQK
ncbi:hypothetical protein BC940DRAFT_297190 [Gongronella butleri]|nr:hypothetical protein BC940DRAFT_297190 [Gongronella butleri]